MSRIGGDGWRGKHQGYCRYSITSWASRSPGSPFHHSDHTNLASAKTSTRYNSYSPFTFPSHTYGAYLTPWTLPNQHHNTPTPTEPQPQRILRTTSDVNPGPLFPAVCDRSPHPLLFSPPFTDCRFPAPGAFPPEPEQHQQHQKRGRGLGSVEAPRACGCLQLASPWALGRWVSRQLDDNFQLRVETTCLGGGTGPELGAIGGGG